MVIVRNSAMPELLEEIGERKLVLFGAGNSLVDFLSQYGSDSFLKRVAYVLDNDPGKNGQSMELNGCGCQIKTPESFLVEHPNKEQYAILITSAYYEEILKQLDGIDGFHEFYCYIWLLFLSMHSRNQKTLVAKIDQRSTTYSIPKKIHYCWFGKKEMPALEKECIKSWSVHCPEYEIYFWNEENYDVTKNEYMKQAYEAGKYSFVSDYARLDVVNRYGGFYLDTDVELLKSIDELRPYKAVFGFEYFNLINTGLGFGSVANNDTLSKMLAIYEKTSFLKEDGSLNLRSCPEYHTDYFKENGVRINNTLQFVKETLFLPSEYLCPVNQATGLYELCDATIGIHKFSCSWFEEEKLREWNELKEMRETYNRRLREDRTRAAELQKREEEGFV